MTTPAPTLALVDERHDQEPLDNHGLPYIELAGRTTESLAPEAWAGLRAKNDPPRLFVCGESWASSHTGLILGLLVCFNARA